MPLRSLRTDTLEIAYHDDGPAEAPPVLLLHGWPDDPRGWSAVRTVRAPIGTFRTAER